jgi:rod shape-determining protein MreD
MSGRVVVRTLLLVAVALLVQTTVVLDVRVGGASPEIMYLMPIAAGIVGGPIDGAAVGFVAGMAADLLSPTPLGLTALVGTLVGFGVGAVSGEAVREVRGLPTVVALGASVVAVMLYAVLGAMLGESQFLHVDLAAVVSVVSVANAVLAGPAVRLMRWAIEPSANEPAGSRRR